MREPSPDDVLGPIAASVERWATDRIDPLALDRAHRLPDGLLGEMAEMGLFGLVLPEAYGGLGLDLYGATVVIERLARRDRAVATTLGLHLGLGTRGLVRWGTPAQHERWLPRLASGDTVAAFATTEPDAGSDLSALRTLIEASPGGGYTMRGSKIFVTNGALASLYTVSGRSPGLGGNRKGQSVLLLERGDEGLVVGPEETKLGLRASSTTTLSLDGVEVPEDRLLGPAGQGAELLRHVLSWGRTVMAAGCVGTAAAALAMTRNHTASRVQFGRTLDQLQVVREQLADMAALTFAAGALVHDTARDEAGLEVRSLSAKVFASEVSGEVCDLALQLHGGYGFIEETGVALLVRDTRITRIFEGANDVLRIHRGLFSALTEPLRADTPVDDVSAVAQRVRETSAAAVGAAKARLGVRLVGDHPTLHALGARAILADATESAAARARREGSSTAEALALRFAEIAVSRIAAIDLREPDKARAERCLEWTP